jgi:hypothetical protein
MSGNAAIWAISVTQRPVSTCPVDWSGRRRRIDGYRAQ